MVRCYGLLVEKQNAKSVKTALEHDGLLNKNVKIHEFRSNDGTVTQCEGLLVIPTTIVTSDADDAEISLRQSTVKRLQGSLGRNASKCICFVRGTLAIECGPEDEVAHGHPLHDAFALALSNPDIASNLHVAREDLLDTLPRSYSTYAPMLLLPSTLSDMRPWRTLLHELPGDVHERLFSIVAKQFGATHIALDAPIPALNTDASSPSANHLRSPTNLHPLFGDFGPKLPPYPTHTPDEADFNAALWVSTRQNGIAQVWAPRYSMFSSGNVSEKARLLHLDSVARCVRQGRASGAGSAAVDLCAGIGYFAFSYARAGVSRVLCWDLNPWSVEGLRRGAAANKWSARVLRAAAPGQREEQLTRDAAKATERLLVFGESNERAAARLVGLRAALPPVRHVNCGMLPTARPMWRTAVEAINPLLGGWIHLHETVREDEIQRCTRDVLARIAEYWRSVHGLDEAGACSSLPTVEHVQKVKSVGPRMLHIVLDITIPPSPSRNPQ